ncbi:hypothetical protein [Microbacterium sp. Marseille-Q6965]|uniref:hypothetical protein n=1 Tax=Microbacterium sp. Marseille-Q6965 TaxID=2965072 RepID=UPI0021B75B0B|nr:hypothetical protein [Microbacterium sp. Marseille-Q6965]
MTRERQPGTASELMSPGPFDEIARDLQTLREQAGPVSYAELVRRITERRLERGIRPAAAAPARSTVYNAFRTGRARLDADLLRDIVLCLGASDEEAQAWVRRSQAARRAAEAHRRGAGDAATQLPSAPDLADRGPAALPSAAMLLFLLCAVAVNLLGLFVAGLFRLTVYLDMVGTAIASLVLGPWHGAAVAVATNSLGFLTGDLHTLPFTPVNVIGALVWGYAVRRLDLGASLSRFVSLNVLTALACSLVAAPIVVAAFHGGHGHASEQAVLSLEALQVPFVASVFAANVVTSIVDKLLSGFIALLAFTLLHGVLRVPAAHMPLVQRLAALRTTSSDRRWHHRPQAALRGLRSSG